jgi:chromosome segregation ATPase
MAESGASNQTRRPSLIRQAVNRLRLFMTGGRIDPLEAALREIHQRVEEIERRQDRASWRVDAMDETIRCGEMRVEVLKNEAFNRLDRLEWGREGLVERVNQTDHRVEQLKRQVDELQSRVDSLASQLPSLLALGWDSLAMARRLSVLEDRTEAMLRKLESDSAAPPTVVSYPSESRAAS